MALSDVLHIYYPVFQVMINVVFFIVELIFGRHFIGIGTLATTFGFGPVIHFFNKNVSEKML